MPLEVLSASDAVLWWVQRAEAPLQIGGLAVFEGAPLRAADGSLRLDDLRAHVDAVLVDVPRFRQRVQTLPFGQGVAWVDDEAFDLARHVRLTDAPGPGDAASLRARVARLLASPLDPAHPLWEVWLLDDIEAQASEGQASDAHASEASAVDADRVAVVVKASHVLADGMALVDLAARLLDLEPGEAHRRQQHPWRADPLPGPVPLMATEVGARLGQIVGAIHQLGALAVDRAVQASALAAAGRAPVAAVSVVGRVVGRSGPAPTRIPLTGRVGPRRDLVWARLSLDEVRHVAHACSATINDVVLAVTTGALARYAVATTAPAEGAAAEGAAAEGAAAEGAAAEGAAAEGAADERVGVPAGTPPSGGVRAIVPVSTHGAVAGDEVGNRFAVVVADLPTTVEDPVERVACLHAALAERKAAAPTSLGARAFELAVLVPPALLRAAGRVVLDHQPVADLAVTNLPGPRTPMYLLGARMLEVYPLITGTGNLATIIGVLSYEDALGVCITVDADVVTRPEVLLDGMAASLAELVAAVGPTAT